jgi:hypothetical protein
LVAVAFFFLAPVALLLSKLAAPGVPCLASHAAALVSIVEDAACPSDFIAAF